MLPVIAGFAQMIRDLHFAQQLQVVSISKQSSHINNIGKTR